MSIAVAPTEDTVMTALRTFLLAIVPAGVEVIQGQANRVPEPAGENFIIFTPVAQERLSTNVDLYPAGGMTKTIRMDEQFGVQLDVHGPMSSDFTSTINLLWRDEYGVELAAGVFVPLYLDEPHQAAFVNGENQYENRWVVTVYMQVNPVVTVPQQSAIELDVQLYEADQ